ncbi:uncharacterized protein VTP21DRAFT_47 [Calcarisporiella thermophila]|uniref:uncharacterized protein n=1 Tax=Calcarisporiella thermophila TaxID=911321 RepID=UPI003744177D
MMPPFPPLRIHYFLLFLLVSTLFTPLSASLSLIPGAEAADPGDVLLNQQGPQFVETVLEQQPGQDYCNPKGQISDSFCDFETVERINADLSPRLHDLVRTKFFKYYKLNLYRECPFWNEYGLCTNRDCTVATMDESHIPEMWRSEALGKLKTFGGGALFQPFKSCQFAEQDFCLVDDEADQEGVYVNLIDNPERFTGYAGESAARIWRAIYEENCFNIVHRMNGNSEFADRTERAKQSFFGTKKDIFAPAPTKRGDLSKLLENLAEVPDSDEEVCLEKRVYYRLISGLHSSISIHICDEYFNQTTGVWGPNLDCFISRIGSHPERLQNVYFDYVILLRAVTKLSSFLQGYEFCTGDAKEDTKVRKMVDELVSLSQTCPDTFDETKMFAGEAATLKEEFKAHFRNVSRIMDCVGCEKCRLWGKLQTVGLGTALKILFSFEDKDIDGKTNTNLLQRSEIVALLNTFNRLSESVSSIGKFRRMYQERLRAHETPSQSNRADQVSKAKVDTNAQRLLEKSSSSSEKNLEAQAEQRGKILITEGPPLSPNQMAADGRQYHREKQSSEIFSQADMPKQPNDPSLRPPQIHLIHQLPLEPQARQVFNWTRSTLNKALSDCCGWVASGMRRWNLPVPVVLEALASKR